MPNNSLFSPGPDQEVTLNPKGSGSGFHWKVQLNGQPEKDPKDAVTVLTEKTGPTKFTVKIAGNPSIKFKDPGALSVWEGDKSAPQDGVNSNQILGPVITDKGHLVFYDLNMGGGAKLNYALHFQGSTPSVDPIIENGGGGQPPPPPTPGGGYGIVDFSSSAFWLLLGAIFLTCLAANLVARMIKLGR